MNPLLRARIETGVETDRRAATVGPSSTVHALLTDDAGSVFGTHCGIEGPKGFDRINPVDRPVSCARCLRFVRSGS